MSQPLKFNQLADPFHQQSRCIRGPTSTSPSRPSPASLNPSFFTLDLVSATPTPHILASTTPKTSTTRDSPLGARHTIEKDVRLRPNTPFDLLLAYKRSYTHPEAYRDWGDEREREMLVADVQFLVGTAEVLSLRYVVPCLGYAESEPADRRVILEGLSWCGAGTGAGAGTCARADASYGVLDRVAGRARQVEERPIYGASEGAGGPNGSAEQDMAISSLGPVTSVAPVLPPHPPRLVDENTRCWIVLRLSLSRDPAGCGDGDRGVLLDEFRLRLVDHVEFDSALGSTSRYAQLQERARRAGEQMQRTFRRLELGNSQHGRNGEGSSGGMQEESADVFFAWKGV